MKQETLLGVGNGGVPEFGAGVRIRPDFRDPAKSGSAGFRGEKYGNLKKIAIVITHKTAISMTLMFTIVDFDSPFLNLIASTMIFE